MGQEIAPCQAISISRRAHELKAAGQRILHMEFGQPSTGAPKAAIAAAHGVLDAEAHDPTTGRWVTIGGLR